MTEEQYIEEPTSELRFRPPMPWAVVLAVLLGLSVLWMVGSLRMPGAEEVAAPPVTPLQQVAADNNAFSEKQDQLLAASDWRAFKTKLADAAKKCAKVESDLLACRERETKLLTSDVGKQIANNQELLDTYLSLIESPLPSVEEQQQHTKTIADLLQISAEALKTPSLMVAPSEQLIAKYTESYEHTLRLQQIASVRRDDFVALEIAASGLPAGTVSLAERVTTRKEERERERFAAVQLELARVRDAADAVQLRQARAAEEAIQNAEVARQAADQQFNVIAAKASSARAKELVAETKRQLEELAADEQLRKRFAKALPRIRELFSPMISEGRMQMGRSGWEAGELGPVSLSTLKRGRGLELTEQGYLSLAQMFCGPQNRNDRPRGAWPESIPGNAGLFREAQELLIEYGDLMVEKGLLQP